MTFDAKAFLESHGGDALAALTALQSDRLRATKAKNAVLEALGANLEENENHAGLAKKLGDELTGYRALGTLEDVKTKFELGSVTFETFKTFGEAAKLPELIKGIPERLTTAETGFSTLKRSSTVRDAAEAYGFKPSVLQKLLETDKLEMVFDANAEREIDRAGKKEKVKGVATITVDGKPVPLESHAVNAWNEFLPALTPIVPSVEQQRLPAGGGRGDNSKTPDLESTVAQKQFEYGSSL